MREVKLENEAPKPIKEDTRVRRSRRPRDADLSIGTRMLIKGV
jgi:hypothetical protein